MDLLQCEKLQCEKLQCDKCNVKGVILNLDLIISKKFLQLLLFLVISINLPIYLPPMCPNEPLLSLDSRYLVYLFYTDVHNGIIKSTMTVEFEILQTSQFGKYTHRPSRSKNHHLHQLIVHNLCFWSFSARP